MQPQPTPPDPAPDPPVDTSAISDGAGILAWPDVEEAQEAAPVEALRDEQTAIVVCIARELLNTVDTRPGGYAWFSA